MGVSKYRLSHQDPRSHVLMDQEGRLTQPPKLVQKLHVPREEPMKCPGRGPGPQGPVKLGWGVDLGRRGTGEQSLVALSPGSLSGRDLAWVPSDYEEGAGAPSSPGTGWNLLVSRMGTTE